MLQNEEIQTLTCIKGPIESEIEIKNRGAILVIFEKIGLPILFFELIDTNQRLIW